LEASRNASEGGELGTDIVNIVDIVIDIIIDIENIIDIVIENILEPLSWAFFSPYSRYPSASALKRAGCSLLSGLSLKSFGFFLAFGSELHSNRNW
jgi:hypothetical protein